MKTNGTIDFERTKVSTLFRRLFFPTLLGMLSVSAVTTIDGIFVGHGVGSDGIAAVNLCIPLLMGLTGVGLMVGAGCSVISSIYLSKGKGGMARASITQALLMVSVVTVALNVVILLFPERTADLLGAVSSAAFMLFPELLVSLFLNPADEAAVIAIAGFPYYGTAFVFFILNLSVIGYYQSIESIGRATVLALLRGFVFLIPCFILMPRLCSEIGVWLALPASEILTSAVIAGLYLYRRVKA